MSGVRDSLDLEGHARLDHCLARGAAEEMTGTLQVSGRPGGMLWLSDGLVTVVKSPGAPGVQALLVRTGRVGDDDWARDGGTLCQAASTARIGVAHLQVLQLMVNQDALFAILAGSIGACVLQPDRAVPSGDRGEDPGELLAAALRKLEALALLPRAILPYRERLAPLPAAGGDDLTEIRKAILGCADGRRTARDIAFVTGRSLYPVTVEMSRMLAEGLLHEPPPSAAPVDTSSVRVLPRTPPPQPPDSAAALPVRPELPRRQPAADGEAEDLAGQKAAAFWKDFLRLGGRMGESRN